MKTDLTPTENKSANIVELLNTNGLLCQASSAEMLTDPKVLIKNFKEQIKDLKRAIRLVKNATKDTRRFLCVWGSWEVGQLDYQNSIQKVKADFFDGEDAGYAPNEAYEIRILDIEQTWVSEHGNHMVTRIK